MNAGVIIFVLLLVLAFLGLPIYLSIGIATMVAMLHAGFPLEAVAQKTFLGMNSSSLLCIPLFILAGNIMAQGITQKLINAANVPLGRVRGSLASVTVLSSALFGAISGSAVATVAAVGGMTVPAMVKEGYDKNYAVACASCSSLLGPMIPPSISLVVYASLTECSIQKAIHGYCDSRCVLRCVLPGLHPVLRLEDEAPSAAQDHHERKAVHLKR